MKGVMAYPGMVFKRWSVCSYFQAQRLGKSQWISIGGSWKSKFRRKNKEHVCLCSVGILENIFWICNLPIYMSHFLHSVQTKHAQVLVSVVGELWWAAEALLIFCLSEEKQGSGTVKPITHISLELGPTWGGAQSCLSCEEHHRVPWNGGQQKGPSVWGVGSNTASTQWPS